MLSLSMYILKSSMQIYKCADGACTILFTKSQQPRYVHKKKYEKEHKLNSKYIYI